MFRAGLLTAGGDGKRVTQLRFPCAVEGCRHHHAANAIRMSLDLVHHHFAVRRSAPALPGDSDEGMFKKLFGSLPIGKGDKHQTAHGGIALISYSR